MMSKNIWRELRRRKMGIEPYSTMAVTTGTMQNINSKVESYCRAYKMGKMVVLQLNFECKNAISAGDRLITVPSDMIPPDNIDALLINVSLRVSAGSGNIAIRNNVSAGNWITGQCVYFV